MSTTQKFQKDFYDRLSCGEHGQKKPCSCGFEERYHPRLLLDNDKARDKFKGIYRRVLGDIKKECILDLCSGSGIHLPLLSIHSETVVGIDISFGLLQHAHTLIQQLNLENVFLIQAAAEVLPLHDNTCDAFIMIDALHHVENQHLVLQEMHRLAKPGAVFLLIEPNIRNPLVYIAHKIPDEERGALRNNTWGNLKRLFMPYVTNLNIEPFNYIASKKKSVFSQMIFRFIEEICENVFPWWPIRYLITGRINKN